MAIKDILVHVDSSRAMPGRVRAAAGLARRHDAHLTGLYVIEIPVLPSYAEAQIPIAIFEAQRAAFAANAGSAEQDFAIIRDPDFYAGERLPNGSKARHPQWLRRGQTSGFAHTETLVDKDADRGEEREGRKRCGSRARTGGNELVACTA